MNNIDLRLMRAFLVLMNERSVSRSAERLGLSQPATSHILSRLREQFDDPLLLRSHNGMVPTDRAKEVEKVLRELVDGYDSLVMPVEAFDPAVSQRTFVITAPEYGERVLVPNLVRRLRREAPNIRVEVRAPDPSRAYEMLESGEIDLRIAWLTNPVPSLRSTPLFQDKMVCVVARDHPTVRGTLTMDQFLTLPHARILTISHTTTSRVIDEALARYGKKLERSFLVQSLLTIPAAMEGTDIIAAMPLSQAVSLASQYPLQVLEPPFKLPRVRYSAFWHERSQKDAGHRWLRSIMKDAGSSSSGKQDKSGTE
jgi:DNA-binding transcriptional LysR family regulator